MKTLDVVVGVLALMTLAAAAVAQQPCSANGKMYDDGTIVCMRGFEEQCVNGSWSNHQRFCADDSQFEKIGAPDVDVPQVGGPNPAGVPQVGGAGQPAVPEAEKPAK
jgi:hypothetical protein